MSHRYQDETPWWIAERAWDRGHLRPWEMLRIVTWKAAQSAGWLSLAEEEFIEERTGSVMRHLEEWRGVKMVGETRDEVWSRWRETSRCAIGDWNAKTGLQGIDGVGYRMATAILCILGPETWPVIDRWAVQTVFGAQANGEPLDPILWERADAYEAYARHLAIKGAQSWRNATSIHDLDELAMRVSQKREGQLVDEPEGWTLATLP